MRLFTRILAAQLLLLLLAGNAWAQIQTEWERTSREGAENPTPSWFGASTERNIAYGVVGGEERLYVASRANSELRIRVLDPDTGEDVPDVTISTAGITGGTLPFNTIAVSADGKIFVSSLAVSSSEADPFKVYMWEDEDAEPVLVVNHTTGSFRIGDNMDVSGSVEDGTATIFVASGSNPNALRWTMVEDNGSYVFAAEPTVFPALPNIAAWGTPAWALAKPGTDRFYAGGRSTTFFREYTEANATVGFVQWTAGEFNQNMGSAEYFAVDGHEFMATYHPTQRRGAIVAIDSDAADGAFTNKYDSLYAILPVMGATTENTLGDLSVRYNEDGSMTVFILATNNGIGAYRTESFLPPPPPEPIAIAEARELPLGTEVTVEAVVSRSRGAFTYAQDETAGITIRQTSGAFKDSVDAGVVREGTRIRVTGTTSEFRYLWQINQGDIVEWEIISQDNAVVPVDVTLAELAEDAETYEGMLIRVTDLTTSSTAETFAAGQNYAVSDPTLGEGTIVLRTPNASDTDVVGMPVPQTAFTFTGALGQFSTTTADVGYQLMLIEQGDLFIQPNLLDDPEWIVTIDDVAWFANDNTMRSGAYDLATDLVLVVSRTGAPNVQLLHPNSGTSVGTLDLTGVAGGTFPINEISVTEDGQIFAANLVVSAGSIVKIYRWADAWSAPEVVYEGTLDGTRYGDSFHVTGSGDDVTMYISGTFTSNIAVIPFDGESAGTPTYITIPDQAARMGIARVVGQDSLWINQPGGMLMKIDLDGNVGREISTDLLPSGYGDLAYFEWDDRHYIVTGPHYTAQHQFVVLDVTTAGEEEIVYETMSHGANANANGAGFAAFDSKRGNIITGATNNAIASFSLAPYENTAPAAAAITSPADGAEVRIEGEGDTDFTATWGESTDPEGDVVYYRWQLSAASDFSTTIVDANVGLATSFTTDFATVAAILDAAGVMPEGSLEVYHRVIASDGEFEVAGEARSVTLIRGTLTNVEPGIGLPTEFALHGNYPNPFNPTTNIRFDLPQSADVRVEIYDILGRRVMTLTQAVQAGANQTIQVDAHMLASGTYLYRVVAEMTNATRIETGKMLLVK